MKTILVTGGAGFAGSNIAIALKKQFSNASVIALDNLKRRGSELILLRLKEHGVTFLHGDIRCQEDFSSVKDCDLVVECAAEPSVLAGRDGDPGYVINTNLLGTINCLEFARRTGAKMLFLSTSRVYPYQPLCDLKITEQETRFALENAQPFPGASAKGIAENFPLEGARTLYGATKLCSEHLIHEYIDTYGLKAVINRCGVLSGPWQMGKVDQGVIVLWVAKHVYGGSLSYIGFNGSGKQVRDVLHIQDLIDLLMLQLAKIDTLSGSVFNAGGGTEVSVSLRELTKLCQESTGMTVPVTASSESRPGDVPLYITDNSKVTAALNWAPKRDMSQIVQEISDWISEHKSQLQGILG